MSLPERPEDWPDAWVQAASEKAAQHYAEGMEWPKALALAVTQIRRSEAVWRQEHSEWRSR